MDNPYSFKYNELLDALEIHVSSMDGYDENDFYSILNSRIKRSSFRIKKIYYTGHPRPVLSMILLAEYNGIEILCP